MLKLYENHVQEILLPFWFRALDQKNGGVYTCFDNTGEHLLSTDKYIWSQGRFLWLWSRLARMVSEHKLPDNDGRYYQHLKKTALFLDNHAFLDNGNCAFLLSETGDKKESIPGKGFDTSFYADCFVIMGMAEYAGLINDGDRFKKALNLYERVRMRLETGKVRSEPYPVPDGYRAHSVPMIMLNVSQGLGDVAEALDYPESKTLREHSFFYMEDIMQNFYRSDLLVTELLPGKASGKDTLPARHINPGHTIECMWFVMHTAQKTGYPEYIQKAALALQKAIELGWDHEYGGLFRYVDAGGGQPAGKRGDSAYENLITETWDMKLWWPHSEALYSTLLASRLIPDSPINIWHEKIRDYTFATFPNPDKAIGEWIQIRDRKGSPVNKVVALPVKDPFHILRNMLLIIDLLSEGGRPD